MKKKKTFWPYGILLSIIACVIACGYTVYVCLDYPVYVDNSSFDTYQNVDNYKNEFDAAQDCFNEKFSFDSNATLLSQGIKSDETMLQSKKHKRIVQIAKSSDDISLSFDTNASKDISADVFLTRPETSQFDTPLTATLDDNKLQIVNFNVPKLGRWQVKIKLSQNKNCFGIYNYEFFVK